MRILDRLGDAWLLRRSPADAAAILAVKGLAPATVITGASRGIGLSLAKRFAADGGAVVLVARTLKPLQAAANEVLAASPRTVVVPVALDLTTPDAIHALEAALSGHGLYLDVLVNNAGIGLGGAFTEHSPAQLDELIAVNVATLTRLTRHVLPAMQARARGGVLNVASLGGYVPGPYQAVYYASKAYVISLTEAIAEELSGSGVRISVVAPGPVATSFHSSMGADQALYRRLLPDQSPDAVAASARRGFALGRRVIVPGALPFVAGLALRLLPHPISVRFVALLLKPHRDPTERNSTD